jgi:hypothetical protein
METFDIDLDADIDEDTADRRSHGLPLRLCLRSDVAGIGHAILTLRALRALHLGAACYPIHRLVQVAARRPIADLLDEIALRAGLTAHRLGEGALLLDGPGVLVNVRGRSMRSSSATSPRARRS